jgi:hypothetical protein
LFRNSAIGQQVIGIQKPTLTLTELILLVLGAYPESQQHLFPSLLQEKRMLYLPLTAKAFPTDSFNQFMDIFITKNAQSSKSADIKMSLKFAPNTPMLYTKFLSWNPVPQSKDEIMVSPFELYLIRFLRCLPLLQANPRVDLPGHLINIRKPLDEHKSGILPIQLFLHYMHYLINPNNPTKTIGTIEQNRLSPSLQQPDFFMLACIMEFWMNRNNEINTNWYGLYEQLCLQINEVL